MWIGTGPLEDSLEELLLQPASAGMTITMLRTRHNAALKPVFLTKINLSFSFYKKHTDKGVCFPLTIDRAEHDALGEILPRERIGTQDGQH